MELKDRIRRAREAAGMTQDELARRVGRDKRTIRNWEAGQIPRNAIGAIERALGVDLSDATDSHKETSPRLDEATDAQVVANLAGRLADRDRRIAEITAERDRRIAELTAEIERLRQEGGGASARWAARMRENPESDDSPS